MDNELKELNEIIGVVSDLNHAEAILSWDQQANMPAAGSEGRAAQMATLSRLAHETFTAERVGQLIETLSNETRGMSYDDDTVSELRVLKREYTKAVRLPPAFVSELATARGLSTTAWARARAENDWAGFESHLARMVDLKLREAEYLGYTDKKYDPLLDQYEPDFKTTQVEEIFGAVRRELVPMVRAITEHADRVDNSALHRPYDTERQWNLAKTALKTIGYDFERGRMDTVPHPFCISFGNRDVRVTNRVTPDLFNTCFFGAMHEGGHALYEQGSPDKFERTALAGGTSLGVHESQSRMWENIVGRSREFWQYFFPTFRKTFRKNAADLDADKMFRAVNKVQPSLIRIEADEVTYPLHIMLRFEVENQLLEGKLKVSELPAWWDEAMSSYLGVTPPTVAKGVLQDVHWSMGLYGYFPTYALGTFFSAQLFEKATEALPDWREQFTQGEFAPLLSWLQENIYRHGKKYTLNELAVRITGEPLQIRSYLAYLRSKYAEIYGL